MARVTTHASNGFDSAGARPVLIKKTIDTAVDNLSATTQYDIFNLAKNDIVLAAGIRCLTAEGATATAELGIYTAAVATDADGFVAAANLNDATTNGTSLDAATAYNCGYMAIADCQIAIYTNHAMDLAKFEVWALVVPYADRG
jgi:hypothetical protein